MTAFTLKVTLVDYLSGYAEREKDREMQAEQRRKGEEMLENVDFGDRLYLFMTDLGELSPGDGLNSLPHNDVYFSTSEKQKLSSCTRLLDQAATPDGILLSFEQTFGRIGTKINGVWKSLDPGFLEWLRKGKRCTPGTIRGVQAELIHTVELYGKAKEEEETKEEMIKLEKKQLAVQRRRETIARKKAESASASATPGVEIAKTESNESSVTPPRVIIKIPVKKAKRARRR
jgi:hypothetical protein